MGSATGFLQREGRERIVTSVRKQIVPEGIVLFERDVTYPDPTMYQQERIGYQPKNNGTTEGWPYPPVRGRTDIYEK